MSPATDSPPIHGVIFDLDGTLLETEGPAWEALQNTVDKFDKKVTWPIKQKMLGLRPVEWAPIIIDVFELQGRISAEDMVEQWEDHMRELMQHVKKCEGAEATTTRLQEMGIPMSIATSSTKKGVDSKRPHHEELFARMEHVITGDDPEVANGKPAPDIYLAAAKRMGLDPKNCINFEDAISGVKAAKAAGMMVIAIPDQRLDTAPFVEAGADLVLKSMGEWDAAAWPLRAFKKRHGDDADASVEV